ncbi:regulator of chromosome condensation repeat-containing protein, partial [Cystoisospora suis]
PPSPPSASGVGGNLRTSSSSTSTSASSTHPSSPSLSSSSPSPLPLNNGGRSSSSSPPGPLPSSSATSSSSSPTSPSPPSSSSSASSPTLPASSSSSSSSSLAAFSASSAVSSLDGFFPPRLVESLKGINVSSVSAAGQHIAIISQNGDLYTWGRGGEGQLGTGERKDLSVPRCVRALQGKCVQAVSCAKEHTVCCTQDGSAYAWGCALNGRLGLHGLSIPSSSGLSFSSDVSSSGAAGGSARTEPLVSECVVC